MVFWLRGIDGVIALQDFLEFINTYLYEVYLFHVSSDCKSTSFVLLSLYQDLY